MPTGETSAEETIRIITEEPTIKVEAFSDKLTIAVHTEETRRRIRLAVKGEEIEVIYSNNAQITPEMVQEELARHSSLLQLTKSLLSEQHALTTQAVDQEMVIQSALQFVPPKLQAVAIKIAKVIISIFLLLQFKSPFFQKTINKNTTNELMILFILKRGITEISKQKATYEDAQTQRPDQQLAELVGVMGEIIYALNNVVQSMKNSLQADLRSFKIWQ